MLKRAAESDRHRSAYRRLRSNPELFRGLLQQQPEAPAGWQDLGILLGDPDAPVKLTEICNPYCAACARAHPVLSELLERNSNVQLRIIFIAQGIAADQKAKVATHLVTLAARQQPGLVQKALTDWYSDPKKNYEEFSKKYPLKEAEQLSGIEIERMNNWSVEAAIASTPTIFLNGYQLPEDYNPKDLSEIL